jgi:chromosome segregation ATPase
MADEIYAPQATARKLNKALRAYKDADAIMRRERFTSAKYKEAISRQSDLKQELEEISRELTECSQTQNRLTRFQTAAPHVQRYQKDLAELNNLTDVILLRPDFEQRFNKATNLLSNSKSRKRDLEVGLARLGGELADVQREPELLLLLADIERLLSEIGKIKASREDLPKRETALNLAILEQEKLCRELGMQPDSVPQLTTEQRKRIETLSSQHFGLQKTREELPGRISRLESRIKNLDGELAALPADTDAIRSARTGAGSAAPQSAVRDFKLALRSTKAIYGITVSGPEKRSLLDFANVECDRWGSGSESRHRFSLALLI